MLRAAFLTLAYMEPSALMVSTASSGEFKRPLASSDKRAEPASVLVKKSPCTDPEGHAVGGHEVGAFHDRYEFFRIADRHDLVDRGATDAAGFPDLLNFVGPTWTTDKMLRKVQTQSTSRLSLINLLHFMLVTL